MSEQNDIDVGVAYFDSPDSSTLEGGWFSVNGEEPKVFSSPTGDLSPQVLWITNLGFSDFLQNSFSGTGHIRNSNFFRIPLKTIGTEVGVYDTTLIPETVEVLSGIASRTVNLARHAIPGLRFNGFSLSESIYASFGIQDQKNDPAAFYQREFQSAFQEHSVVTARRGYYGESEIVRFIPNRVGHAEAVLDYPIPAGDIREIAGEMSMDEFMALGAPAIAEIKIDASSSADPGLLAFGAQYSSSGIMREWMAQPEAYFMHKMGVKIKIFNVLAFSTSAEPPQLPKFITENAVIRNSYSAGLLADNFLVSLMSKRRNTQKKFKNPNFFPSRAVYMRSVDRMLSYSMANVMNAAGVRVTSYGFGIINAKVSAEELPDAVMLGADMGFSILATPTDRFGRG